MVLVNQVIADEKVTITINGESYSRDIPNDYEGAVDLIKYLANLERTADIQVVNLTNDYVNSMNDYETKISELGNKIEYLEKSLSEALESAEKTEKDVDKLTSINSRFTMFLNIGPIFGYDRTFVSGVNTEIIFDYRIFRNLHIGGNVFLNALSAETRSLEFGFGLVLGYSLY